MKVVPELYCENLEETLSFYIDVLQFKILYSRESEGFSYLSLNGVDLMFEELKSESRKWVTDKLEKPFGRGVNFQFEVVNVELLYKRVRKLKPEAIYLLLETKEYLCGDKKELQTQFIVKDPNGYLFRFCSN